MTIKRAASLIMAVIMVFSVFTMTAVAATEACDHNPIKGEQCGVTIANVGTGHIITYHYRAVCSKCGEPGTLFEESGILPHSYSIQDLINQYHSGKFHYYVYSTKCVCGSTSTQTVQEFCGNPCGNIHLSVPDENI